MYGRNSEIYDRKRKKRDQVRLTALFGHCKIQIDRIVYVVHKPLYNYYSILGIKLFYTWYKVIYKIITNHSKTNVRS